MDLCWLVMTILDLGGRTSARAPPFFPYRSLTNPPSKSTLPCQGRRVCTTQIRRPRGVRESRVFPSRKMGVPHATFKRRGDLEPESARALGALRIDVKWPRLAFDDLGTDHDLFDAVETWQFEHRIEQDAFHDRTQAARAGAPLDRLLGDHAQRLFLNRQIGVLHLEQALILFDERVLRLSQDLLKRILVEILKGRDDRQTADEFGNEAEFQQILRLDLAKDLACSSVVGRLNLGGKADRGALTPRRNDSLEARKGSPANEQDIGRIDLQELLLGML